MIRREWLRFRMSLARDWMVLFQGVSPDEAEQLVRRRYARRR